MESGSIGACPKDIDVEKPIPDRVERVRFHVRRVLKGEAHGSIEFLVIVPELYLCKRSEMTPYTQTIAFLKRWGANLNSVGGRYALYQRTESNYGEVVRQVSEAMRSEKSHP